MFTKKETVPKAAPKKNEEDWMTKKWRPMMAIMYMFCCLADFFIFPIMFTVVQFWETQAANDAFRQWNPITLGGGGLFHVAMGAVLGITAFGRTQEKMAGVATGPAAPTLGLPNAQSTPSMGFAGAPASGSMAPTFNQPATSFGAPAAQPNWSTAPSEQTMSVTVGFGGKAAPPPVTSFPER